VRANLRGFNPFSAAYGVLAGEEVVRFTAHTFSQLVEQLGSHDDFLGHADGDNFIVITETQVPLMTLNAQLLTSEQGPFYDIIEQTQAV
jgi:GGDEF domain-containing protein